MYVGVVTIKHLDHPRRPVSNFLNDLLTEALTGLEHPEEEDEEEEGWGGGWDSNGFVEFSRKHLDRRAKRWADKQNADDATRGALMTWIANLPWDGHMIMLQIAS